MPLALEVETPAGPAALNAVSPRVAAVPGWLPPGEVLEDPAGMPLALEAAPAGPAAMNAASAAPTTRLPVAAAAIMSRRRFCGGGQSGAGIVAVRGHRVSGGI